MAIYLPLTTHRLHPLPRANPPRHHRARQYINYPLPRFRLLPTGRPAEERLDPEQQAVYEAAEWVAVDWQG